MSSSVSCVIFQQTRKFGGKFCFALRKGLVHSVLKCVDDRHGKYCRQAYIKLKVPSSVLRSLFESHK
jgi:hypothetical protein